MLGKMSTLQLEVPAVEHGLAFKQVALVVETLPVEPAVELVVLAVLVDLDPTTQVLPHVMVAPVSLTHLAARQLFTEQVVAVVVTQQQAVSVEMARLIAVPVMVEMQQLVQQELMAGVAVAVLVDLATPVAVSVAQDLSSLNSTSYQPLHTTAIQRHQGYWLRR
jgi:hypothetical protein